MKKAKEKIEKGHNISIEVKNYDKEKLTAQLMFEGELTIYNVNFTKKIIIDNLKKINRLDLNLAGINKIDTAGFQLLLVCANVIKTNCAEKEITFSSVSPDIQSSLQKYGEIF